MKKTLLSSGALLLLALLSGCSRDDVGDITPPVLTAITPVADIVNNSSPAFVFQSSESGLLSFSGDCHSEQKNVVAGINTLTFSSLSDGVYDNCVIQVTDLKGNLSLALPVSRFVVDTLAPVLEEVTPVLAITNDTTPGYSFRSSEQGIISYAGSCVASVSNAKAGKNAITFNALSNGTYNDCEISVVDSAGNVSAALLVPSFTIDDNAVVLAPVTTVPRYTRIANPSYTFSSNKAGTIEYAGACSSLTTSAVAGNTTVSFNTLVEGTYNNCKLRVRDSANNLSAYLNINLFTVVSSSPSSLFGSRPNIIVIVADDQGYADLGVQGVTSDVKTPNIDSLANEGIRLTSAYVTAPICGPSRAGLVTGRYQQRFGYEDNNSAPLPLSETTIAARLKVLGYKTGHVGKWHLDITNDSFAWLAETHPDYTSFSQLALAEKRLYFPYNRGFDYVYAGQDQKYWVNFLPDGSRFTKETNITDSAYRVDAITAVANRFILMNSFQTFFLSVNYFAPHFPLEATQEYLDKVPLYLNAKRRYGYAMIAAIDDGVGSIVQTLKDEGIYENTLLIYLSDNGAPVWPLPLTGYDPDNINIYGNATLNLPFKGGKQMLTEGGIREPFIMHWKGVLPENTVIDKPVSSLDIGSTALSLAGNTGSTNLDGVNLMEYLLGTSVVEDRTLFWRFRSQQAVRKGKWKYLSVDAQRYEYLYDLDADKEEQVNVISANPAIAAELKTAFAQWQLGLRYPETPVISNSQEKFLYSSYYGLHFP